MLTGCHLLEQPRGTLEVKACGRTWKLERCGDLESMWEGIGQDEFAKDERIPYWTEVWPSSFHLAEWLEENRKDIAGRNCLDLGCGLGLTAIIASWLGARVAAFDYEWPAVRFARDNATLNGVEQPLWLMMDWRDPSFKPQSFSYIWGGDIMYERRFFEPLSELFSHALAPGGKVILSMPERSVTLKIWDEFRAKGWRVEHLRQKPIPVEGYSVNVNLWRIS